MIIKSLSMENFRNYENQKIEFDSGKNFFFGLNGQGKTNIIEALYYFCTCKSFRSAYDKEVIKFGNEYSHIRMEFETAGRLNTADIYISEKKSVKINGINLERLSELIGMTNMVIFTPEHLNLIREGPGVRRSFIDVFISQIKPHYFSCLIDYYKVLKQRNNMLKNPKMYQTVDIWDEKLSELGIKICKYRRDALSVMDEYIKKYSNEEIIDIVYCPSVRGDSTDKENFLLRLRESFERDKEKGITMVGPHRDDFDVLINGKSLKKYGSQGQTRSSVLKIKLCECEIIKSITGEEPVLLLDDVLSELDEKRRKYFSESIRNRQVIITCTDREYAEGEYGRYFLVQRGNAEQIF